MSTADDNTGGAGDGAVREKVKVSLARKYDIPIEHLSYEHIEECNNAREMELIVKILRSGEEGTFPHLIEFAENKLAELNPKCILLRKEEPALVPGSLDRDEWTGVKTDLLNWTEEVKAVDMNLGNLKINSPDIYTEEDPIRTMTDVKKIGPTTKPKIEVVSKPAKSVVPRSYADWDKFDADEELLRLDTVEERKKEEREVKNKLIEEKEATKRLTKRQKREKGRQYRGEENNEVDELKVKPAPSGVPRRYPGEEAFVNKILANQERVKGNEFFKQGDYAMAIKHFKDSVALTPTVNAYNNLALALYKMNDFEEAIEVCDLALELDPDNVKSLYRRGTSCLRLQMHRIAALDLQRVIELDPQNKVAAKLLASACEWVRASNDKPARRMKIVDHEQNPEEESENRKNTDQNSQIKAERDYLACISNKNADFTEEDFAQLLAKPNREKDATGMKSSRPKIIELSSTDFTEEMENEIARDDLVSKPSKAKIVELDSADFSEESDNRMVNENRSSKPNRSKIVELSSIDFEDGPVKMNAERLTVMGDRVDSKELIQAGDEVMGRIEVAIVDEAGFSSNFQKDCVGNTTSNESSNMNGCNVTVHESSFSMKWKSIENDPDMSKHAAFLLQFEPDDLPKLLGNDLDLVVHAGLILCLEKQAALVSSRVIEYVCGIVECTQFRANRQRLSKDIDDIFVRLVESIVVQHRGIPVEEFEAAQQASGEKTQWRLPANFCNWEANEQLKLATWGRHPTIAPVLSQAKSDGDSVITADN